MNCKIQNWLKSKQPNQQVSFESNTYTEPKQIRIDRTVYPNWEQGNNGSPQLSPNGSGEWYGLTESKPCE